MTKTTAWIRAMRLRTLPLSVSGILIGSALAIQNNLFDGVILGLALATTILFQVLSNLANDLGDSLNGADNENRIGPMRSVQSGIISVREMKTAVVLCAALSAISAASLIYYCATQMPINILLIYCGLAILAILAAITYTVGKKAYGYHGLGDVFVFIFFGGVSVLGVYGLYAFEISTIGILWAICIGGLSSMVLNLNNMRDVENDAQVGKNTLVVKLGFEKAKFYHTALYLISLLSGVLAILISGNYLFFLTLIPFVLITLHLRFVWSVTSPALLDPELKKIALSTFFISIIYISLSLV
jgi:1,4-dihydroxy-2-naphthoate polyprenyltransferase